MRHAGRQGRRPPVRAQANEDRVGLLTRAALALHDLQQGGRTGDLPYYRELARRSGSALELGAGTGRVALELAGLTDLWVNDADRVLLDELVRRARARSVRVTTAPGDATGLALGRRFDLVLAPASFAQIVGGPGARRALMRVIARHLAATGLAVVAIADVDEILRECATPAGPQLAATAVAAGARVGWEHTLPGGATETVGLTIHRVGTEDVAADAHACGLGLVRVHRDPGDATELGSSYCVLRRAAG